MITPNCIQNSPTPIPRPIPPVHASNDERWTPSFHVEKVRAVLGDIDLDPFSCAGANKTVKANRFFAVGDHSLGRDWKAATVFMSPPLGRQRLPKAAQKFISEWCMGKFKRAIVLVNGAPDDDWYNQLLGHASAICTVTSPLTFVIPAGMPPAKTGVTQVFLLFGRSDRAFFRRLFSSVGTIQSRKQARRAMIAGACTDYNNFRRPRPDADLIR